MALALDIMKSSLISLIAFSAVNICRWFAKKNQRFRAILKYFCHVLGNIFVEQVCKISSICEIDQRVERHVCCFNVVQIGR